VAIVGPTIAAADLHPRILEAQYGRDSGLRVGVGYQFADCWDATWNYTYFFTNGAAATEATADNPVRLTQSALFSLAMPLPATGGDFAFGSSLNFQLHDLEFGRWINLDKSVALRLFGGFRWAMIDQKLAQSWHDALNEFPNGDVFSSTGASLGVIDMEGFGIRLGSEARWKLPAGFSLFGKGSASVLAGHFHYAVDAIDTQIRAIVDFPPQQTTTALTYRGSTTQAVPVLEAAVGAAWTYYQLEVSAGYELSAWFNMANRYAFTGGAPVSNDLLLDGLFLRVAFTR
jgi:Legionella pneumophila major outer membrane protein precursor